MGRAWVIYIVMFAALIGGLLLIMAMGDSVHAPDDLSGEWQVVWENALPPEAGEPTMRVAQSGRYFVVRFGSRPPMSMTLQGDWSGAAEGRKLEMKLAGTAWAMTLSGDIPLNQQHRVPEVRVDLVGPTTHRGMARRVPRDQTARVARTGTGGAGAGSSGGGPVAPAAPAVPAAARETAHAR